jgi:hypothetical protein
MQIKFVVVLTLTVLFSISAFAVNDTEKLAHRAISKNKVDSANAIKLLRRLNRKGLEILFEVYSNEINDYSKTGKKTDSWLRIAKAIDLVAMQKDAYSSRLYWHVDFEKALAKSRSQNKPILSLRLLGNLNEEFTCANSRFFRSILYSNERIADYLRANYILHWKSVRPAPKVTIDFGDGRKVVRTITGNSIHYVLDENGAIVDALPGLYNPKDFLNYLRRIDTVSRGDQRLRSIYWNSRRNSIFARWNTGLRRIGVKPDPTVNRALLISPATANRQTAPDKEKWSSGEKPTALEAAPLAVTKSVVEMSTVRKISYDVESLKETTKFEQWKRLSSLFNDSGIDENSKAFIRLKTGRENTVIQGKFAKLIANLEKYLAIDTVQNEFLFHTKIYDWLILDGKVNVDIFNNRVYEELFLTPKSDRWLGLYSSDIYSAIENNGLVN